MSIYNEPSSNDATNSQSCKVDGVGFQQKLGTCGILRVSVIKGRGVRIIDRPPRFLVESSRR